MVENTRPRFAYIVAVSTRSAVIVGLLLGLTLYHVACSQLGSFEFILKGSVLSSWRVIALRLYLVIRILIFIELTKVDERLSAAIVVGCGPDRRNGGFAAIIDFSLDRAYWFLDLQFNLRVIKRSLWWILLRKSRGRFWWAGERAFDRFVGRVLTAKSTGTHIKYKIKE